YRPLDRHRQEIRVVVLQPAADLEAPLVACLRSVYPKDSPTPKFEALSYVWGEPIFKHPIQLNGCDKFITKNLFQGLRRLREKDQERVLWIDALGINQDDVQEKQHQIPLMKEIYSLASCVIAWLGE
ncbi:heterokaryon incompatibility protein-domain-containing protein, partial [Lophiotrema nucula]